MNIKYLFLISCVAGSYITAMDLQSLTGDLQARKELAAKVSKKISVGSLENKSSEDVVVRFDTFEGKKSFTLKATTGKQVVYLNELIKLTQLKGKPDYMAGLVFEKQTGEDDPYRQMTIHLALNCSSGKSFNATTFPPIQGHTITSSLKLDMILKSEKIVVDAIIAGDRFMDSTVSCRFSK